MPLKYYEFTLKDYFLLIVNKVKNNTRVCKYLFGNK